MDEPISIPIRDDGPRPEASGSKDPTTSVADRLAERIVEAVVLGASMLIAAIDDGDEEVHDLAAAGAGFVIEGARALGTVMGAIEQSVAGRAEVASRAPVLGELLAHWRATWERAEEADAPTPDERFRGAVDAILDRLDLTEIVRTRVDIQRVAGDLDLNELVADLDVESLVEKVDIEAVAAKIDVNAIAQRLDLEAFLARVDMVTIATELIEQLDLAQLIREASRDTASDGVRTVRLRGVDADRAIRRAVDRVLGRDDHSEHA